MFNVINMNGRVYDPQTAMFFSPDPFIQSGGDWKNYNRYSYCMNNPTRYTDPSGYKFEGNRLYNDCQRDSWGDYCQSAAGAAGRNSILNAREAHQKSSITYNYDNGKYEYVNGEEATFEDAIKMYHFPKKVEKFSTYGFDHLYTFNLNGKNVLFGSIGGEITGFENGSIQVTNNGTGFTLNSTDFQIAYAGDLENEENDQNNLYFNHKGDIVTSVSASASIYKKLPTTMNPILSTHYGEVNFKGGKSMGKIGIAGNLVSTYISGKNIFNDPSKVENYSDALFTGLGWVPVYGDFGALLYMGAKDQINIRKENILNNRDINSGVYVPATGDVWIYN